MIFLDLVLPIIFLLSILSTRFQVLQSAADHQNFQIRMMDNQFFLRCIVVFICIYQNGRDTININNVLP